MNMEPWKEAVKEEMGALEKNNTWKMVSLSQRKRIIRCKWIFTIKYMVTLERYKVRLVVKRYTQTYGFDYLDTYALVAKMNIVRVLLPLATNLNWPLQQFDVKNFLHKDLEDEVYMDVLPRFIHKIGANKVC